MGEADDPRGRDGDGPSNAELDDFIRANDVDIRAAADLKDCTPEIQRKVLSRGDLSTARNPSAALLARIRDARGGGTTGLPSTKEVDDYVASSGVDRNAAEALRSASPAVKRIVLASGSLAGVADPSATLLERIQSARSGRGVSSSAEVEDFIKENDLDERAAEDLRELSDHLQRAVLARGDLKTARNPSSALMGRIRDAKMGIPAGPPESAVALRQDGAGHAGCAPPGWPMPGSGAPMAYPAMGDYGGGYPSAGYPGYPPGYGMPPGYPPYGMYPGYPGVPGYGMYPGYPGIPGYPQAPPQAPPQGGVAPPAEGMFAGKRTADDSESNASYSSSRSRSRRRKRHGRRGRKESRGRGKRR